MTVWPFTENMFLPLPHWVTFRHLLIGLLHPKLVPSQVWGNSTPTILFLVFSLPHFLPWTSFLCAPSHLVGDQIYSKKNEFTPTSWVTWTQKYWGDLDLTHLFLSPMGKVTEPHNYSNEFQGPRSDSSCLHWVSLFKINTEWTNGFREE